jgi:metal-responsive CopG/Arc/MetJ family transcriptional regulator
MARKSKPKEAGRPAVLDAPQLVSVRLPGSLIARIDGDAEDNFEGRSDAMRRLLDSALRRKGK